MDELRQGEPFTARSVPLPDLGNERIFPGGIWVKALFEPECKWRLVEELREELIASVKKMERMYKEE